MKKPFRVIGRVVDLNDFPLKGVHVSINDKDQFMDDFLGMVVTNEAGEFMLSFGEDLFNQDILECEKTPDLFLMLFLNENRTLKLISREIISRSYFKEGCIDLGCIQIQLKKSG